MSSKSVPKTSKSTRNSGTGRNKAELGNTKTNSDERQKHRAYCWTLNNYTEAEVVSLKSGGTVGTVEKMIFGMEVGEQGTPHLQGFTRFVNPISWGSYKKSNPRQNFRVPDGTDLENYIYCSKDNIEHCVGMEKEALEAKEGKKKKRKAVRYGGYSSVEEQVENSKTAMEQRIDDEETVRELIESKRGVDDEVYNDYEIEATVDEWASDDEE